MARSQDGRALTEAHRLAQLAISRSTVAEFLAIWNLLDPADVRRTFPEYYRVAKLIIDANRRKSAALAAAYFSAFRAAEGAKVDALPIMAEDADDGPTMTSLFVTGPVAIERAQRQGREGDKLTESALVLSLGAASRIALNGGRETLYNSTLRDSEAHGIRRVTSGATCSFCRDLAALGPIRKAEGVTSIRAHDHCGCSAEAVYDEIFD